MAKDEMIQTLIKDEVKNFHAELQELFFRCKNINLNVGSEEEKGNLVLKTDSLLEFYKELKDTTDSQGSEVYYLKQALMQSFAWYEDTRARHKRYTDPNFASLLQAQELDPVSEKQMADIKHLIYYIEAQLKQIDGFLDNQWADFQDACKKHIKGKLHIPTLEPIYQSLVRQNAILERQKYVLKDIGARIKSRNRKAANYPHVMNKLNASTRTVDNLQLYEELHNLKIEGDIFQARYEKIVAHEKKLTDTKKARLYDFFSDRKVNHIAPRKPKFVGNIFQVSPSKFNVSPYAASPSVNRSLRSTFDSIAQQSTIDSTINTSVEANLSSSNLFSFTLLEGGNSTKFKTPEKDARPKTKADLLFNTPKASDNKTMSSPFPKLQESSFSQSIFNFTATSTAVTQSKHQNSTSTTFTPTSNFSFDQSKFASIMPDAAKSSSSSNTTFFSFSSPNPAESKTSEINKTTNVAKSSTFEPSTFLGGLSTGDNNATQSFNFIAPQSKPPVAAQKQNLVKNIFKGAGDVSFGPRESLDAGFSFGNLDVGQQSTPKPKSTAAPPSAATTSVPDTTSKPAFSFVQTPAESSTPQPFFTGVGKPVANAVTTVSSFFGQSTAVTASPSMFGLSQSSSSSIFSSPSSTELAKSTSSTFDVKSAAPAISSTATSAPVVTITPIAGPATPSITVILPASSATTLTAAPPSTFSLTQLASAVSSTAPAKTTTPFGGNDTATTTAPSIFASTSTSSFSFIQPIAAAAAATTSATTTAASTPSIFGSTATSGSIFGSQTPATTDAPKSASIFGTQATATETTKSGSIFGVQVAAADTTKSSSPFASATTPSSTSTGFASPATTAPSQSGFGFGSQTTASENSFSFGQLTVSALSPNANSSTSATPAAATTTTTNTTAFSFALPAASSTAAAVTSATSSTNVFGGFASPTVFGKPATTTTASSFMGQSICSPSAFSQSQQSTGSIFAQPQGNVFAQKASTTASGTSIFGQPRSPLFGQSTGNTPAATTASSLFGQTQSSPFGSPAQSTTSGGSLFEQSTGFTSTAATTAGSSIFSQNSFGSPATTSATGNFSFTQSAGSSSGFGSSGGSIFGGKPSFGATPAFGQPPAFGSPSAFGATTPASGNVFGSPAPASNPGSFGSGFGQKPAFGSPPSFGQTAFGSPPAFGATPTFGVFVGGAAPAAGNFGAAVQENSTFANLANQSTLGFGSLAQNQAPAAPQQQAQQFSGGAQFSSWR